MRRALGLPEDREEAVIGLPEDRVLRTLTEVKLDLSTRQKEFENLCFPCEKLFDTFEWQNGYLQHWKFDPAKTELFMLFQTEVLQRFQSYQIPVIKLKKTVQKEPVCHVFEKANTGDVVLNAFELLTATYAAENFRLRDDWYGSSERNVHESTDRGIAIFSFFCKPPIQKGRCRRGQGKARRDRNSLPRNIGWLRRARLAFGKTHVSCLRSRCTTAPESEGCCTAGQPPIWPFVPVLRGAPTTRSGIRDGWTLNARIVGVGGARHKIFRGPPEFAWNTSRRSRFPGGTW
jgi:hypothetical protein